MKKRVKVLSLCVVLFGSLGCTWLQAQSNGAMVYVYGSAKVNGTYFGETGSVFSGDKIDTSSSSVVSIHREGSSIAVNPNSSVKYAGNSIDILSGSARVATSNGMAAQIGKLSVAPQAGSAKYDVVSSGNNQVVIASHQGTVAVNTGSRTVMVGPGTQATFGLTGAVAQGPIEPGVKQALLSPTPMYELGSDSNGDPNASGWCPNVQSCKVKGNVSPFLHCKCKIYF